jgi:DUF4097 and DUF4098 domain-containing protein YvlB
MSDLVVGTVVVACALAASGCVEVSGLSAPRYVERDEKRFPVSGRPDLRLSTFDGSVEIRAWDRPEVLVVIEKRAGDKEEAAAIEVRAEQNGDRVVVDVKASHLTNRWHGSRSANLIVSIPARSDVQASSGDGSLSIARIAGTLDLRSGDGSIHGSGLAGDLRVHTGDGSIDLDDVTGGVDIDTGDGSILVAGQLTRVRARSGDGRIAIRAASGSTTAGDWDINTGDGSITIDVPGTFGGELDARTGDGGIHLRNVALSSVSGELDRHQVRGRLGPGGQTLRVRTGDGSITIGTIED